MGNTCLLVGDEIGIARTSFASFSKGLSQAHVSTTAGTTQDRPQPLRDDHRGRDDGGVPVNHAPQNG